MTKQDSDKILTKLNEIEADISEIKRILYIDRENERSKKNADYDTEVKYDVENYTI